MDLEISTTHLRSTELNTFGMINTIYRDLLCRATGGKLSIEGVELRNYYMTEHLYAKW